jgi:electron transfer flavoprotein beta subunit
VLSVTAAAIEPRYPSLRGIMAARSRPVETLDLAALGLAAGDVGGAAARQEVLEVHPAPTATGGEVVTDEGNGAETILEALTRWKVI